MTYTTSIVIPIFKNWKLCHALLSDINRYEKDVDEVVVVDDFSEDSEVAEGLDFWVDSKLLPITVLRPKHNGGFTVSSNIGLRYCEKPLAVRHMTFLISSDVRITGRFIPQAADLIFRAQRSLIGNRHIAFDSGWNTFDGKTFDYLEGYFLGCASDGWRDLGYFDENYAPYDMEDIDLSTTAKRKGYKLVSLNNPNIQHKGGGTIGYNPQREAITVRNKEYFRSKWIK
jgi:GT2 family glycosyltransferase